MSPRDENMIAALKRERAAYVAHGKDDRVKQVDDQLRRLGYNPQGEDETGGPQGRTPQDPAQQTADQNTGPQGVAAGTETAPVVGPPVTEAGTGDGTAAAPPTEEKTPAKKTAASRRSTAKE
ncbi:hypothetical protein ACIRFF_08575 [Streptomyces cyaneofuscatus]